MPEANGRGIGAVHLSKKDGYGSQASPASCTSKKASPEQSSFAQLMISSSAEFPTPLSPLPPPTRPRVANPCPITLPPPHLCSCQQSFFTMRGPPVTPHGLHATAQRTLHVQILQTRSRRRPKDITGSSRQSRFLSDTRSYRNALATIEFVARSNNLASRHLLAFQHMDATFPETLSL